MVLISPRVGAITKKVRNMASPMITWFGGIIWVPMAWRVNERTMTIRVKEVIKSRIAGARLKTVKRARSCKLAATS
ncbi:hypothetical protein D3C87_1782970 [compost metagenome]